MDEAARIAAFLRHPRTPLPEGSIGPGADDAAVVPFAAGADLVATTDLVSEGVHFFRAAPPRQVGRFAVNVNLSDLAAMGAAPVGFLAAYATPRDDDPDWVLGVAEGVAGALVGHGCPLIGGDTKESGCRSITGTALGAVPQGGAVRRGGARPGDLLVLTGPLGGPAAALALHEGRQLAMEAAMEVVLGPTARLEAGRVLREAGAAALVDLSDGLARAAGLMAQASAARLEVAADLLPLDPLVARALDHHWADSARGRRLVLGTGGEYELLAAIAADKVDAARAALAAVGCHGAVVGEVTVGDGAYVRADAQAHPLDGMGWSHFA